MTAPITEHAVTRANKLSRPGVAGKRPCAPGPQRQEPYQIEVADAELSEQATPAAQAALEQLPGICALANPDDLHLIFEPASASAVRLASEQAGGER